MTEWTSDFGTHTRQNPKTLIDRRMGAFATAEWLDPDQLCNPDCDSRLYFPFPLLAMRGLGF
jgi:hypothetical protein